MGFGYLRDLGDNVIVPSQHAYKLETASTNRTPTTTGLGTFCTVQEARVETLKTTMMALWVWKCED